MCGGNVSVVWIRLLQHTLLSFLVTFFMYLLFFILCFLLPTKWFLLALLCVNLSAKKTVLFREALCKLP